MRKLVIALALAVFCASQARAAATYLGVDTQDVSITGQSGQVIVNSTNTLPVDLQSAIPAGTNNIGDVDVLTLPSIPAGANSIGTVGLNAGSNSIGTLGANSGVDIGDVTINNTAGAGAVNIQDGGNSLTIDATALPLPTGAATEATLSTVAGDTTSLDSKIPSQGQATMANSVPVAIASDQSAIPVTGNFDVSASTIQVKGPGAFAYARQESLACSPTNVSFTGLIDEIELQAIGGSCTYTILGGDSITIKQNTAESFKLNYTASGTASTVSCTAKGGSANCKVKITGSN